MFTPLVIIFFIILLSDSIFFKLLRKHFKTGTITKYLWFGQSAMSLLFIIIILSGITLNFISYETLFSLIFYILLTTIPKLAFLVYAVFAILPLTKLKKAGRISFLVGVVIALTNFLGLIYGRIKGVTDLEIIKEDIYSPKLPHSFDGFKIVQITDMHIGGLMNYRSYLEDVISKINEQNPDIVLFTGDLVNSLNSEITPFIDILSKIESKYGVFTVMGNHDYGDYFQWETEDDKNDNLAAFKNTQKLIKWDMLDNESRFITKGNDTINIIGVENWGEPPFGQHGDLKEAMKDINQKNYSILLSHNPVHWREEVIPGTEIDITFSGHTHAMQFQIGSYSPSSHRYNEWAGIYTEGNQTLVVNNGIGYTLIPVRIGASPQIYVITLRTE